jgi:hypothetical protein
MLVLVLAGSRRRLLRCRSGSGGLHCRPLPDLLLQCCQLLLHGKQFVAHVNNLRGL